MKNVSRKNRAFSVVKLWTLIAGIILIYFICYGHSVVVEHRFRSCCSNSYQFDASTEWPSQNRINALWKHVVCILTRDEISASLSGTITNLSHVRTTSSKTQNWTLGYLEATMALQICVVIVERWCGVLKNSPTMVMNKSLLSFTITIVNVCLKTVVWFLLQHTDTSFVW